MLKKTSIQTRVTLFTLLIFLVSIWALSLYARRVLQADMQIVLGEQQLSTGAVIAAQVNEQLRERMAAIELYSHKINTIEMSDSTLLEEKMQNWPILQQMFNDGIYILNPSGLVLAQTKDKLADIQPPTKNIQEQSTQANPSKTTYRHPSNNTIANSTIEKLEQKIEQKIEQKKEDTHQTLHQSGLIFKGFKQIQPVLTNGKPMVSAPFLTQAGQAPFFFMSAPIHDLQGKLIGILVGSTNLGKSNFLDKLTGTRYGNTGYLLIAPKQRLIITATDKSRVMEQLPAPGISPDIDRFLLGYEGTAVFVNPTGVEVLSSDKAVPIAGWIVSGVLPTSEAFAPIYRMQRNIFLATIWVSLLAAVLVWWMIHNQLTPLLSTVKLLSGFSNSNQIPEDFPVSRNDEIGEVISGFNKLLKNMRQRENLLRESEAFKSIVLNSIDAEIAVIDGTGNILAVNQRWNNFAQENNLQEAISTPNTGVGSNYLDVCCTSSANSKANSDQAIQAYQGIKAVLNGEIACFNLEYVCPSALHQRWFLMTVMPLQQESHTGAVITHVDISERKQAEAVNVFLAHTGSDLGSQSFFNDLAQFLVHSLKMDYVCIAQLIQGSENSLHATSLSLLQDGKFLQNHSDLLTYPTNQALLLQKNCCYHANVRQIFPEDSVLSAILAESFIGITLCNHAGQAIGFISMLSRHRLIKHKLAESTLARIADRAASEMMRQIADNALMQSETRFRCLLQNMPFVAIQGYDSNGITRYWNRASEKLYGYTENEALGRSLFETIIPQELHQGRSIAFEQMFVTGQATPAAEIALRRKDDSRVDVFSSNVYMHIPGREAELFCIDVDITERKQQAEALRIAATAFESQQSMIISDAQRVILRVNPAFTAMTGFEANDVVGKSHYMLGSDRHDQSYYNNVLHALNSHGHWAGEFWCRHKHGEAFLEWLSISVVRDDAGMITHYVAIASDLSERIKAQTQIDLLAYHDPLTQLPNRRRLLERLDYLLQVAPHQSGQKSSNFMSNNALLFIDLDNFKMLNDTLGHLQGDQLLLQLTQRLKNCVNEADTLARLGSDEFAILIENLSSDTHQAKSDIEITGNRILSLLQEEFKLAHGAYHCTASIGISLFGNTSDATTIDPLKHAELAMFHVKANGRNGLRFFDAKMQAEVLERAILESDFREAMNSQQLVLHYQSQVVGNGRVTGVEALVRWLHPQRGLVFPAEFIPLAEETGLILPMGLWVLETACNQLHSWQSQKEFAHLSMSVNVSACQFKQDDFVESVLAILASTKAKPKLLKLEITESILLDDVETIITKMGTLKAHGVSFSLDDFGTGFSSLAYLKRLPLDQLKIDQGFIKNIVSDPNDAAIAKMVVALAESLGLSVIAEGVELQAQADFLAHQGCHAYQGYLFSQPRALLEFETLMCDA